MAKVVFEHTLPSYPFEKRVIYIKDGKPLRIGRAKRNEVEDANNALFNSQVVSAVHAYLTYRNGKFYLEDRSTNGTFINGFRLIPGKKFALTSGDVIELGTDVFFNSGTEQGLVLFVKLFPIEEDLEILHSLEESYPFHIQLYSKPPLFEIDLELLQECIYQRLKVLQVLSSTGEGNREDSQWIEAAVDRIKKHNVSDICSLVACEEDSPRTEYWRRRKDHVSHFLVLVAVCKDAAACEWFARQEVKLLQIRWHYLTTFEKRSFLRANYLYFDRIFNKMIDVDKSQKTQNGELYYEVGYREISELVRTREIVLKGGKGLVSLDQLIFPVSYRFEKALIQSAKHLKTRCYEVESLDERVSRLLRDIARAVRPRPVIFNFNSLKAKRKTFSASEIDRLSQESFPLCMEKLHRNLCTNHHLRNGGRYQYSLFLKGIGVSLHDSLNFWKHHFTKRMTLKEFIKEYSYHIRHCYGTVGKCADYPPLNCNKILSATAGPNDYHGCPFKREESHSMMELLRAKGIKQNDISGILELMEQGMPELACSRLFQLTHDLHSLSTQTPSHPNIYYLESRSVIQNRTLSGKEVCKSCSSNNSIMEW